MSGPALESLMATRHYSQLGTAPLTAKDVFEKAHHSDPAAMAVVLRYKDDLARFLGGLTSVFDPHYFVLGGGLSLQSSIYEGLSEALSSYIPPQQPYSRLSASIRRFCRRFGGCVVVALTARLKPFPIIPKNSRSSD